MNMQAFFEGTLCSSHQSEPPCLYFTTSDGGSFYVVSFVDGIMKIGVAHTVTIEQTADYVARLLSQVPKFKHLKGVKFEFSGVWVTVPSTVASIDKIIEAWKESVEAKKKADEEAMLNTY